LEDKRLGNRGTVAVGALAITAMFMITVMCLASIIVEYNRYAYAVKTTSEKLLMRGKEKLSVERTPDGKKIRVRNEGSTTSFIIGVFAVKNDKVEYVKIDAPVVIKILSTQNIPLPRKIRKDGWKISVLTVYGNIFWEESYM